MKGIKSKQNSLTFFSFAIRLEKKKEKEILPAVSIIWHQSFRIENSDSDGCTPFYPEG
jgi:hypothetical protein